MVAPHWADTGRGQTGTSGPLEGPVAPALRYRAPQYCQDQYCISPQPCQDTERKGWTPTFLPTPHPCLSSLLSPTLTTTFLERDMALPPPAESGREVGTRHPSPTARQPSPSSPLPWETTWPLASSPAVLGSLGRVTAITVLGTGLKIRRARRAAGHGGARGRGNAAPLPQATGTGSGDGQRRVCPGRGSALTR